MGSVIRVTAGLVLVAALACGNSAAPPAPSPPAPAPASGDPALAHAGNAKRCLPVVARACGCVYSCGVGVHDGDRWSVTHPFWQPAILKAKIAPWCSGSACTDVFDAEIACDGMCAAPPADPTCHFDSAGACVGAPHP